MERDSRRDHGQWRGCHRFQDIVPIGAKPKRTGGLTMGETYYYYYEVDGSTEIHDPSMPSTSVCPFLPGQTLNTLEVPIEHTSKRLRSASMNSVCPDEFKTMDPQDKFTTPRPAPLAPCVFGPRLGTSDGIQLNHKVSSRSLSPAAAPSWTGKARRLFGLRPSSRHSDRTETPDSLMSEDSLASGGSGSRLDGTRSTTPSEECRSRDLSPELLRRFLLEDIPLAQPPPNQAQRLSIPDIVEENEDDDNFATSAVSESTPFTTLSPPPFQRSFSSPSVTRQRNGSTATIVPETTHAVSENFYDQDGTSGDLERGSLPSCKLSVPQTHFPYSAASSTVASPVSPQSVGSPNHNFSFFDELTEEDDSTSEPRENGQDLQYRHNTFMAYSLPQPAVPDRKQSVISAVGDPFGSPEIVTQKENDILLGGTSLLTLKGIDTGLDDLVSELGWIASAI